MAPPEQNTLAADPDRGPDTQAGRTAILVLGMHRSGTSAVTRVISILGADLPSNLMPAVPGNNETGFWESMDVYELNDELLQSGGSTWDDWRRFNPDWYGSPVERGFLERALAFVDQDFSNSPFFVLKDPRISRILPFWQQVLEQRDIAPRCVIAVRNPLEVASSLRKRDGFSSPKSLVLWLRHMLDAELATRSLPRSFVAYDALLEDWRQSVTAIAEALELRWPALSARTELEVDRFLGDRYRHHSHQADDLYGNPMVSAWVKSAYAAFLDLCRGEVTGARLDELDALRGEFDRAGDALGAVVYASEAAEVEAKQRAVELEDERTGLLSTIEQAMAHTSELEQDLGATHTKAAEVGRTLGMRDVRVHELEQRLADAHALGGDRDARVHELEQRLADAHALGGERNARLQTVEHELQATHLELAEIGRTLEQRDQQASDLKLELQATHAKAAAVGEALETRDHWLTELKAEEQRQAALYLEARGQQYRLAHALNVEHASATWQLTRPLRAVERRLPRTLRATVALPKTLWWALSMQLPERLRFRRSANALIASRLFDENWYVETYPDVVLSGFRPIVHWMRYGWREGRMPNRLFDTNWYLGQNPGVAKLGIDPLLHYVDDGVKNGLNPHPGFDSCWYLQQNPDVAEAAINPLLHFLTRGEAEGRTPVPPVEDMPMVAQVTETRNSDASDQMADPSQGEQAFKPDDGNSNSPPVTAENGSSENAASASDPESVPPSPTAENGSSENAASASDPESVPPSPVPPWYGDWVTLVPLTSEPARRILVVDWRTPTPDLDSGSYRITNLLNCLVGSGLSVDFIADREAEDPRYAADLVRGGINLIVGYEAAIEHLTRHGPGFCAAILSRPEVAERYMAIVRAFAIQAKVIYDTVDLHWVRFARSVKDADNPAEISALSEYYKRLELANARAADLTVAITEEERQLLLSEDAELAVSIIPNIHETVADVPAFETRRDLFFIGGFDHKPNVDAMHYFVGQVLPLIVKELKDVKLYIVGSKMPDRIRALASANVDPVGFVEDVRPYFEKARIFVAPLRHGAGMKGKVGQSLSFGLPVVTTSVGAEGIGLENGKNAFIADTAEDLAAQVVRLYGDKGLWDRFSKAGRDLITERFSEAVVREQILALFKE